MYQYIQRQAIGEFKIIKKAFIPNTLNWFTCFLCSFFVKQKLKRVNKLRFGKMKAILGIMDIRGNRNTMYDPTKRIFSIGSKRHCFFFVEKVYNTHPVKKRVESHTGYIIWIVVHIESSEFEYYGSQIFLFNSRLSNCRYSFSDFFTFSINSYGQKIYNILLQYHCYFLSQQSL